MTDNEIIKALEIHVNEFNEKGISVDNNRLDKLTLDLIYRLQAEIERLHEHYKNLAKASIRHAFDTENDRQLLHEYQNIFLGLGYGLKEVQDPELKEIKSWKDRAIWHVKRCDQLSRGLKAAKSEAIKEFAEGLKEKLGDCYIVSDGEYCGFDCGDIHRTITNLLKEMVGETK